MIYIDIRHTFVNISGLKYIQLSIEDIKSLCPNWLQFYFWLTDGPNDTTIDMFSASGNKQSNEIFFNFLNIFCLLGKSELIQSNSCATDTSAPLGGSEGLTGEHFCL